MINGAQPQSDKIEPFIAPATGISALEFINGYVKGLGLTATDYNDIMNGWKRSSFYANMKDIDLNSRDLHMYRKDAMLEYIDRWAMYKKMLSEVPVITLNLELTAKSV